MKKPKAKRVARKAATKWKPRKKAEKRKAGGAPAAHGAEPEERGVRAASPAPVGVVEVASRATGRQARVGTGLVEARSVREAAVAAQRVAAEVEEGVEVVEAETVEPDGGADE